MRALGVAAALLLSAPAGADSSMPWRGALTINYSPTTISGELMVRTVLTDDTGMIITCTSDRSDFMPCDMQMWGYFEAPPRRTQQIVLSVYKDGERIFSQALRDRNIERQEFTGRNDRWIFSWDAYAGTTDSFLRVLANGGPITIELADANGLAQSIPYGHYTYEVPALPQRAIDILRTMRHSEDRPRNWAQELLGPCASLMARSQGQVYLRLSGQSFERTEC